MRLNVEEAVVVVVGVVVVGTVFTIDLFFFNCLVDGGSNLL